MRFTRRSGSTLLVGGLPMTSLIDVVFLLLIYFMVTASMTAREAELASALQAERQGAGRAADLLPQILIVSRTDRDLVEFKLGDRVIPDRNTLVGVLTRLSKEAGVIVRGAASARVEDVTTALQSCKDAGFRKVTYVPAS
ncbi:MAG: biopolymer transporter ExbD [Phycisphaeraceae bacterium]|nr:biopolymer transporter ExbD [Phycisphaeraceae bacterium]